MSPYKMSDEIDIEDIPERAGELADIAAKAGLTPEVQDQMGKFGDQANEAIRKAYPDKDIQIETVLEGKTMKFTIGGQEISVTKDGVTYQYGDAITNPNVSPEESTKAFVDAFEKATGIHFPDDLAEKMTKETADNNPQREINVDKAARQVEANSSEVKSSVVSSQAFLDDDAEYDRKGTTDERKAKIAQDQTEKMKTDKLIQDQTEKIKELTDKLNKEPGTVERLVDKYGKDVVSALLKIGALLVAGFFTYEMLKEYQQGLKGCWQATSTGSSVNKVKIFALTCDSCCNASGTGGALTTICDYQTKETGLPCTCPNCTKDIDPSQCTCGSACYKEDGKLCSAWCDNSVRILKDRNGNNNAYSCENPSLLDTVGDLVKNVEDIFGDLFGGAESLFQKLLKYGLYVVAIIVGLVLLYVGYKIVSFFYHNGGKQGASGHASSNKFYF